MCVVDEHILALLNLGEEGFTSSSEDIPHIPSISAEI
jgi:hypothetical protein